MNHLKDFFVNYRLPDDWYYPWNHGHTYDLSFDFFQQSYIYIYEPLGWLQIDTAWLVMKMLLYIALMIIEGIDIILNTISTEYTREVFWS